MKRNIYKFIAFISYIFAIIGANSACGFIVYQKKEDKMVKNLRRF